MELHYRLRAAQRDVPLSPQGRPRGCPTELAQELLPIMVGKQISTSVQEVAILELKCWWQKQKLLSTKEDEEGESALVEQAHRAAFLIAFTSVFLPRAYYRYIHGSSLHLNST
ncbi:anoctamin-7 [Geothlypis trichas]